MLVTIPNGSNDANSIPLEDLAFRWREDFIQGFRLQSRDVRNAMNPRRKAYLALAYLIQSGHEANRELYEAMLYFVPKNSRKHIKSVNPMPPPVAAIQSSEREAAKVSVSKKQLNRPTISKEWEAKGVVLEINLHGKRYSVAHDDLLEWVGENLNALNTRSWKDGGVYHWPSTSKKMLDFLESKNKQSSTIGT